MTGIIKNVQQAVPFTQHDLTMFSRKGSQERRYLATASGNNLRNAGQQSQSRNLLAADRRGAAMEIQCHWGERFSRLTPLTAKTWFNQDGSPIGGP